MSVRFAKERKKIKRDKNESHSPGIGFHCHQFKNTLIWLIVFIVSNSRKVDWRIEQSLQNLIIKFVHCLYENKDNILSCFNKNWFPLNVKGLCKSAKSYLSDQKIALFSFERGKQLAECYRLPTFQFICLLNRASAKPNSIHIHTTLGLYRQNLKAIIEVYVIFHSTQKCSWFIWQKRVSETHVKVKTPILSMLKAVFYVHTKRKHCS